MNYILGLILLLTSMVSFSQEFNPSQQQFLNTENLLKNPGFESGKTSFTITGATSTLESTVVFKGKKSLKLVTSSQVPVLSQHSTSYQAQFADGVQGLASLRIKTTHPGLRFCSANADIASTSNCVNVNSDNKWALYKVPFILGATSNGFVLSGSSGSGTTYIDDAFVGAVDLKTDQTACSSISCETVFTAVIDSSDVAGSENYDFINGNCTNSTAGTSTCNFNPGIFTTTPICHVSTTEREVTVQNASSTLFTFETRSSTGTLSNSINFVTCTKAGQDYTNATYLSRGGTYTSNNADKGWTSYTPTGLWANTTYAGKWRRVGEMMEVRARGVVGTGSVTGFFGVQIPTGYTIDYSKVMGNTVDVPVGTANIVDSGVSAYGPGMSVLHSGVLSNGVIVFYGNGASTQVGLTSSTAPFTFGTNDFVEVEFRVPIVGWDQSNIIIGQFKEVVTSQGSNGVDIQSVYFGGSAGCTTACTTGTCTICTQVGSKITSVTWASTGGYNLNGIDSKYVCSGNGHNGSVSLTGVNLKSTSTSTYARHVFYNGATPTDTGYASVTCIGIP